MPLGAISSPPEGHRGCIACCPCAAPTSPPQEKALKPAELRAEIPPSSPPPRPQRAIRCFQALMRLSRQHGGHSEDVAHRIHQAGVHHVHRESVARVALQALGDLKIKPAEKMRGEKAPQVSIKGQLKVFKSKVPCLQASRKRI